MRRERKWFRNGGEKKNEKLYEKLYETKQMRWYTWIFERFVFTISILKEFSSQ